jgi:hypothetical protein
MGWVIRPPYTSRDVRYYSSYLEIGGWGGLESSINACPCATFYIKHGILITQELNMDF